MTSAPSAVPPGPPGSLSRRGFLSLAGTAGLLGSGALGAGLLTGCGTGGPTSGGTSELDLYTWEGYDLNDALAAWRASAKVDVKATFIGVQDDVATRLTSPAATGVDLSTANQSFIGYFNSLDIMSPITVEELPELDQLFDVFKGKPWRNDDGTFNSVPWTWGPLGLTYVPDRIDAPTRWDDLFDSSMKGRLTLLDDPQQHTQLVSAILGYNPDQLTKDQLAEVKDYLIRIVRQSKTLTATTGDQVSLMESGEIDLVFLGWTGIDAAARDKGFTATTMIPPKSRSIGFSDASFVAAKADNRDEAIAFCRQLITGQVAAAAAEKFYAATTNPAVVPMIDEVTRKPYPYDDIASYFSQLTFPQGFPREAGDFVTLDEAVKMWEEVKAEAP